MSGCSDSSVSGERRPISSREFALLITCIGQARVQARRADAERVEHRGAALVGHHGAERGGALVDGDPQVAGACPVTSTSTIAVAGLLPDLALRHAVGDRPHVMRRDGRVADERHLAPGREEADLDVVFGRLRGQHEGDFGAVGSRERCGAFRRRVSCSASRTTAAGLPQKRSRVNVSTRNRRHLRLAIAGLDPGLWGRALVPSALPPSTAPVSRGPAPTGYTARHLGVA